MLTRQLVDLIKWPLTGTGPRTIAQQGRPLLGQVQRDAVLDALGQIADAAGSGAATAGLRQQAVYLLGSLSPAHGSLDERRAREVRLQGRFDEPGPGWLHARALAIALANRGDKALLLDFVQRGLATDATRELNLRYYAAWLGDTTALISWSQLWRPQATTAWSEHTVLDGLRESLRPTSPILELTARSLRLLLERSPTLGDTVVGRACARRALDLLADPGPSLVARRDLAVITRSAPEDGTA